MLYRTYLTNTVEGIPFPKTIAFLTFVTADYEYCLLIVLFHRLNRLDPSQGLPKAFKTKQRDLQQFFKPAQEGPDVKSELRKLSYDYISSCTTAIRAHYERQLNSLQEKISKSSVSLAEFQQAVLTAIKWGKDKKNFHKKLSDKTLTEFHRAINKLKLTLGKKESQVNIPIISTPKMNQLRYPLKINQLRYTSKMYQLLQHHLN